MTEKEKVSARAVQIFRQSLQIEVKYLADLAQVVEEYLEDFKKNGYLEDRPRHVRDAFVNVTDSLNRCRFLISKIEELAKRAERLDKPPRN